MVPDILNTVFHLLEQEGFPMGKKKHHLQMDHNAYPMRFGIVLKENLERYAYVSNIPRLQRFSISVLQPSDIRYLSNLFSIKCHETMMNQSTNQSIS